MSGFTKSLFVLAGASGCMLTPTDDQRVTSTTAALSFTGYTNEARAPVQVRAWDFAANAMVNIGVPVNSAASSTVNAGGTPLFSWSASRSLPARFWRSGPAGGHCAAVGARATVGGRSYDVISVESDWGECYADHPSASAFYTNCRADNSPVAKVYTSAWGSLGVTSTDLALAALVLQGQVRMTFDNYTPTAYEFCHSSTPGGCPPGLSADPETYKYYRPDGSSLVTDDGTITFSITPSRSDPMTVYIDDMSTRATNRYDLTTSGGRLRLGINFEAAGPEIRMNCIRNIACAFVDGKTLDFTAPRAVLAFELGVEDGAVVFTDVTTTFTTGSSDPDTVTAGNGIAEAITEKLMTDANIRDAVNGALDQIVRGTSGLGAEFPVAAVTVTSTGLQVQPGCPLD
jgi:hypothetical protein